MVNSVATGKSAEKNGKYERKDKNNKEGV